MWHHLPWSRGCSALRPLPAPCVLASPLAGYVVYHINGRMVIVPGPSKMPWYPDRQVSEAGICKAIAGGSSLERGGSCASTTAATRTNPVCPQANDAMFKLLVLAIITATDMVQFNALLLHPHFNLAVSWCAVWRLAFAVEARCTSCRTAVPLRRALRAGRRLPSASCRRRTWRRFDMPAKLTRCSPPPFPLPPSLQVAHRKLLDALSVCEQRPGAFHAEVVQPLIDRAEAGRRLEGAVAFASTGLSAFEVKVRDVLDEDVAPQVGQGAGELVPGHAWSACFAPPAAPPDHNALGTAVVQWLCPRTCSCLQMETMEGEGAAKLLNQVNILGDHANKRFDAIKSSQGGMRSERDPALPRSAGQ